jgi:hypothetical protein
MPKHIPIKKFRAPSTEFFVLAKSKKNAAITANF